MSTPRSKIIKVPLEVEAALAQLALSLEKDKWNFSPFSRLNEEKTVYEIAPNSFEMLENPICLFKVTQFGLPNQKFLKQIWSDHHSNFGLPDLKKYSLDSGERYVFKHKIKLFLADENNKLKIELDNALNVFTSFSRSLQGVIKSYCGPLIKYDETTLSKDIYQQVAMIHEPLTYTLSFEELKQCTRDELRKILYSFPMEARKILENAELKNRALTDNIVSPDIILFCLLEEHPHLLILLLENHLDEIIKANKSYTRSRLNFFSSQNIGDSKILEQIVKKFGLEL